MQQGHYETALLWKQDLILPNNGVVDVSRLLSTEKKLKKNPQQVEKYQEVINNYVSKGEILKSHK